MKWFTDNFYQKIEAEDLSLLAELDQAGILCGDQEDGAAFAGRLRGLQSRIEELESDLKQKGASEISGIPLRSQDRIPEKIFCESHRLTGRLYDFTIDWVPGFFLNHGMGFLFGGCAFCFFPDFFALFIIRASFRKKKKWLCYNREELLAHELCHVARMPLQADEYEEMFAYQTANSFFRRLAGGIFRSQMDSFLFLGATMLLLCSQILRTFWFHSLPPWPFWSLLGALLVWQISRHILRSRRFWRAVRRLEEFFGPGLGMKAAFRCTDSDVDSLSRCRSLEEAADWLRKRCTESLRWRVVFRRYGAEGRKKPPADRSSCDRRNA